MDLEPLWQSGPVIATHAIFAIIALFTGIVQLALPKGTLIHRGIGTIWVILMASVAITGFWINELRHFGPFSWIHLLSILTLIVLARSILLVRSGRIKDHRNSMVALFFLGLVLTGGFTLLPGRVMHAVFLGA
ncbi:MAG: DUF2306 domain-containing protein [Gammaproteobacteria bacterium]|nr:DUF2306 domain-containing protein [Gammaproteobacteria bacterium]MCY4218159.1 DUF2306 domain-containing protein [Gammaproteobacteria bacterium]MCY4275324.1 DUF2306 domain-containing protein [Gammaproteobacteria bacterium]